MVGQTVSHYRILEKLGEGGMGAVYLAEDTHLGRRVAVKFPAATEDKHHFRARFLREARAASRLSHPNIATIYDYGETGEGDPFIVMELVEGQPLSEQLHDGKLTLARVVEIIIDVAAALGEAHALGIVHRDIKPSNVVISGRGQVKVLDFGLAKQLNEGPARGADLEARTLPATRTQSGVVLGTPLYLSPEQARGAAVDARSDLFALGAVLYECVAGRSAFARAGAGVVEIAANILHLNPPPPSDLNPHVTPELDRLILKALAKRPEERFQSASELAEALRATQGLLAEGGAGQTRTRLIQPAPRTGHLSHFATLSDLFKRPRLSVGVVIAGVLLVALAGWLIARGLKPAAHQPSAEARRWYEMGANALRDGAYYQASKALEQAVAADDDFALAHAQLAEALMELDYVDRAKDEMLRVAALVPDRSALQPIDALYLNAVTATVSRDFASAVKAYSEIARLTPEQAHVYVDLGRAQENQDETKEAVESYLEATRRNRQYATAFLHVGRLYGRQQDVARATSAFDRAEEIYQAAGNVEGRAEVSFQRGYLLRNMGKFAESRPHFQRALELARAASNPAQQIKILLQLSNVAFSEGDTGQAQQDAREAVDLAQASGMENLASRGLVDLGNVFFARGDYGEAEKYYKQALESAQRNKARRNEARARIMLGSLRHQQGNAAEAVTYVEQALSFYQQGGYRKETSQALLLLGHANLLRGDYDAALGAFERQLQLAQESGDSAQVALSHEGIGTGLSLLERYPEALGHYEQRYLTSKSAGDQRGMAYGLANRASVLWRLGRYEEARTALDQASAAADRPGGGMKALTAQIRQMEAEMILSERRFPDARARAEQALALAGAQYTDVASGARRVLGLAQVSLGAARDGRKLLEEEAAAAKDSGDPQRLSTALLGLAQAMLEDGDAPGALSTALRAEESFGRAGQQESEWRAWLIAALAGRRAGDEAKAREYALQSAELLSGLRQKWGAENYTSYLARPDVQYLRKRLGEEFGLKK